MRESKKGLRQRLEEVERYRDAAWESSGRHSDDYDRFRRNLQIVHPAIFTQYITVQHYPYGDIETVAFDKFAADIDKVATEIHEQEKLTETYTRVYGLLTDEEI